jgi:hypothetical protein
MIKCPDKQNQTNCAEFILSGIGTSKIHFVQLVKFLLDFSITAVIIMYIFIVGKY